MSRLFPFLLLTPLLSACTTPPPSALALNEQEAVVVVKTVQLPADTDWYARFAHHSWIELHLVGEDWQRVEIPTEFSAPGARKTSTEQALEDTRWNRPVQVLEVLRGEAAARAGQHILEIAEHYPDYRHHGRGYHPWPGPNSNSYIAWVIENTPELHAELDHNAVGKDDTMPFRLGLSSAGYGVEVDTPYLGAGVGLRQGVELHLLGLTFGISLWPPAVKIPFLPRLGFQAGVVGAAGAFVSPEAQAQEAQLGASTAQP